VFQAWFDDSGKEGVSQSPVYLLAGYSARVDVWNDFVAEWQEELSQTPRLQYLKASDAYNFEGQFGFNKETQTPSDWITVHGRRNENARDARLSKFVKIIAKQLRPPESYGLTWLLAHGEYQSLIDRLAALPTATIRDIAEMRQRATNPYYLSFQKVLGQELKLRVAQGLYTGNIEKTEILLDEGIDSPANLEEAFKQFTLTVKLDDARYLNFLQNTKPEYRDDKFNPPLQAADLLAWHIRRMCLELSRGAHRYDDPIWLELHETSGIKYWDFRYEAGDWDRIATNVRVNALLDLGLWIPPNYRR
jgi:Protein of unknown function (DUF3800)